MRRIASRTGAPGRGRAADHEGRVGAAPHPGLHGGRQEGLDHEGIREQPHQRAEVRQCEEPVHGLLGQAVRHPGLEERPGGRKHEVGQADGQREQQQDAQRGVGVSVGLERNRGNDGQAGEARGQKGEVHPGLAPRREPRANEVRVGVAGEQRDLEEDQARGPHRRGAAEPRQDLLGDDGLDKEQQERRQQDRRGEQQHGWRGGRRRADSRTGHASIARWVQSVAPRAARQHQRGRALRAPRGSRRSGRRARVEGGALARRVDGASRAP